MDLILERFLSEGYPSLNAPERQRFEALLELPDQDVYQWILGSEVAPNAELTQLAGVIRKYAVPNPRS